MVTTDLFIHEHVFRVLQTIQLAKQTYIKEPAVALNFSLLRRGSCIYVLAYLFTAILTVCPTHL